MKNFPNKTILSLGSILAFMALCTNLTTPIPSASTLDESRGAESALNIVAVSEGGWTWTDFGGAVVVGGAAGAARGAMGGLVGTGCPAGAAAGATTGIVAGAVCGAVVYAGMQAWNAIMGNSTNNSLLLSYSETALD
jgi:hypothetical protein